MSNSTPRRCFSKLWKWYEWCWGNKRHKRDKCLVLFLYYCCVWYILRSFYYDFFMVRCILEQSSRMIRFHCLWLIAWLRRELAFIHIIYKLSLLIWILPPVWKLTLGNSIALFFSCFRSTPHLHYGVMWFGVLLLAIGFWSPFFRIPRI